jgi:hypothetical protein
MYTAKLRVVGFSFILEATYISHHMSRHTEDDVNTRDDSNHNGRFDSRKTCNIYPTPSQLRMHKVLVSNEDLLDILERLT